MQRNATGILQKKILFATSCVKLAIRHLKPEFMLVNFCKGCEKRCIHAASCTHRSIVLSKAWARSTEASDSKRNLTPDGGFNQL